MPSERWSNVHEIAFRVHGDVVARYENPRGQTVLDVEVSDEPVPGVELSDELLLSVFDPDDRYPAELVGESRTLGLTVEGFSEVRPADRERTVLEVPDEGRLDVVGQRTARSSWDGETLMVPIDVGLDELSVPIRETTRPSREPNAHRELLEEAGVADCEYVAVDGARVTLYAVDLDIETDPWAGVVFEDVTFEIDTDDESFRTSVRESASTLDAPMGIAFGPRWFFGDADTFKISDIMIDGHVAALMTTLGRVLDGDSATHRFMDSGIQYEFDPVDSDVTWFNLVTNPSPGNRRGRCLDSRFPPDGVLVDIEAFASAVVEAAREMVREVEKLNPAVLDRFENVEASADALERKLRTRDSL